MAMGARPGGKLKAGVYMLAGLLSLLQMTFTVYFPASTLMSVLKLAAQVAYYGAALLSVLSFADYLSQYQKLIREKK
jgi:CDP-diacylglycerol--glycerol-3-phosphate 3-phosphatidyltransferase